MYDRFQQIAFDAQISAVILGNQDERTFVLIALGSEPTPEDISHLAGSGFGFVGVTGVVDGVPRTEFAVELDAASLSVIAQAWIQYLAGVVTAKLHPPTPQPVDDSIPFLERLYALNDARD
jgi:hypothetical protein